jgi:hypothetical protein
MSHEPVFEPGGNHAKICGDFGEHLTMYILSKYGFECARVDHTGIDVIARHPRATDVMGISCKARSRSPRQMDASLHVPHEEPAKVIAACAAFNCVPFYSLVIDRGDTIAGEAMARQSEGTLVYILPLSVMIELYPNTLTKGFNWSMTEAWIERYKANPKIVVIEMSTKIVSWWT